MLDISKRNLDHLSTTPANEELARGIVLNSPPSLKRTSDGIDENKLTAQARLQAAGVRKQNANERTREANLAKNETEMRYRAAGQEVPPDISASHDDDIQRCLASEAAADAEHKLASDLFADATYVYNKKTNTLAGWSRSGARVRTKPVKIGRGDPHQLLAANLARQRERGAEYERIRNAEPPVSLLKERLGAKLDALLAEDPYKLNYAGGGPDWEQPVTSLEAEHLLPGRVVTTLNLLPLLMDLLGDDIRERLMARIDQDHQGDTRLRMAPEQKQKSLKRLKAEVLELQREHAALIVLLAGNTLELAFPPGMAVEAMLGVETY